MARDIISPISPWRRHDPEYVEKLAARLAARIQPAERFKPHQNGAKITPEMVRCIRKRHAEVYSDLPVKTAAKRLAEEYHELRYQSIIDIITRRTWRNT